MLLEMKHNAINSNQIKTCWKVLEKSLNFKSSLLYEPWIKQYEHTCAKKNF